MRKIQQITNKSTIYFTWNNYIRYAYMSSNMERKKEKNVKPGRNSYFQKLVGQKQKQNKILFLCRVIQWHNIFFLLLFRYYPNKSTKKIMHPPINLLELTMYQ